jgi:hypothetical protein
MILMRFKYEAQITAELKRNARKQGAIMSATVLGKKEDMSKISTETKVDLAELSEYTGFPIEFIKRELLIKSDMVSLDELRSSMSAYLDSVVMEKNC